MAKVRKWYVDQALQSVKGLIAVLPALSEDEVLTCLELESNSRRRKSVINRLIGRAARIRELQRVVELRERYQKWPEPKA